MADTINLRAITLICQQAATRVRAYCDRAEHSFVCTGNESCGAWGGDGGYVRFIRCL